MKALSSGFFANPEMFSDLCHGPAETMQLDHLELSWSEMLLHVFPGLFPLIGKLRRRGARRDLLDGSFAGQGHEMLPKSFLAPDQIDRPVARQRPNQPLKVVLARPDEVRDPLPQTKPDLLHHLIREMLVQDLVERLPVNPVLKTQAKHIPGVPVRPILQAQEQRFIAPCDGHLDAKMPCSSSLTGRILQTDRRAVCSTRWNRNFVHRHNDF
jgi:hypothetical protein